MNKKTSGLASGSIMVTLARIVSSVCAFVLFWVISQKSVEQLGAFRTLFVFFLLTESLPLLGMNQYIIREIAKTPDKLNDFLLHAFLFSLAVSCFMIIGLLAISFYGGYSPVVRTGLYIVGIGIPATAAVLCLQSVLIACGKGGTFGGIQGVEVVIRTVLGVGLILWTHNVIYVMAGFIVIRWLIVLVYRPSVSRSTGKQQWQFSKIFFRDFIKRTPQFAGILVLFLVIRFAGQLMVPWMEGDTSAGYFAIAYQFLDLILLVPTAFAINLMPVLSKKAAQSISALRGTGVQAIKLVATIMIPCTIFVFINCKEIIFLIFGQQYQPAVVLVELSIWAGLIFSLDQVLSTSMIAAGRQDSDLYSLLIGAVVTIAAMYGFISMKGVVGAAIALLVGTGTLFVARVILFNRSIVAFNIIAILRRQIMAGAVMAGVMYVTRFNWVLSGISGLSVYAAVLIGLGTFNPSERKVYKELFASG